MYMYTYMHMHKYNPVSGMEEEMPLIGSWALRGQPLLTKKRTSSIETITKSHDHFFNIAIIYMYMCVMSSSIALRVVDTFFLPTTPKFSRLGTHMYIGGTACLLLRLGLPA